MTDRLEVHVESPPGGWPHPWPNVAELATRLPTDQWTLVGGLMTQLLTIHRGIGVVRPTNDVDIVLHIETSRGVPAKAALALESLGYRLLNKVDPRDNTAHRWVRDTQAIDVGGDMDQDEDDLVDEEVNDEEVADEEVAEDEGGDAGDHEVVLHEQGDAASRNDLDHQIDVLTADHPGPRVVERMSGRDMVPIEGGTQALKRTMNAHVEIRPGEVAILSVPRPFAGVILKSAAYMADSRDRDRHLFDAAALLACVDDPFEESEHLAGSDRRRIRVLVERLPDDHAAWEPLESEIRAVAQAALRILGSA